MGVQGRHGEAQDLSLYRFYSIYPLITLWHSHLPRLPCVSLALPLLSYAKPTISISQRQGQQLPNGRPGNPHQEAKRPSGTVPLSATGTRAQRITLGHLLAIVILIESWQTCPVNYYNVSLSLLRPRQFFLGIRLHAKPKGLLCFARGNYESNDKAHRGGIERPSNRASDMLRTLSVLRRRPRYPSHSPYEQVVIISLNLVERYPLEIPRL